MRVVPILLGLASADWFFERSWADVKERMPANQKEEVAMFVRRWSVAVLGMCLGMNAVVFGQEAKQPPPPLVPAYQPLTLAQTIASTLKESVQL